MIESICCKTCVSNKYQEERHPDYDVKVPCDDCSTIKYSRWESAKQAALVDAAKALLTFLEDKGTVDINTGGGGDRWVGFCLDKFDLVAFPDTELTRLQEALDGAIKQMEGKK